MPEENQMVLTLKYVSKVMLCNNSNCKGWFIFTIKHNKSEHYLQFFFQMTPLKEGISNVNEMSKTLNELNQKLEKEINDAFDELVKMMNDRRNELVSLNSKAITK